MNSVFRPTGACLTPDELCDECRIGDAWAVRYDATLNYARIRLEQAICILDHCIKAGEPVRCEAVVDDVIDAADAAFDAVSGLDAERPHGNGRAIDR